MTEGTITIYNAFKNNLAKGVHDFNSAPDIRVSLHSGYTPDIDAHAVWADVSATEYGTGDGYTADGETLSNPSLVKDDPNDLTYFDADDALWSSLGSLSPATPSHAIIRDNAQGALIGFVELGVKATNGGDYTIAWNVLGIFEIT